MSYVVYNELLCKDFKMKKTWYEKIFSWRNALDQLGHLGWGYLVTMVPAYLGAPLWLCFLQGSVTMLPRELYEQWPIERWYDTAQDLVGFGLGGVLSFYAVPLVVGLF